MSQDARNPTVTDMVERFLRDNGFDGLYREGCGCEVCDLAPCGEMPPDCRAGFKSICQPSDESDLCDSCGELIIRDGQWHIGPKKEQ